MTIEAFRDIETYCMFLGHPRSGHTLVASLLDAHSEIVIAHELHALRLIQQSPSKEDLLIRLATKSHRFTGHGRHWNGYNYMVPNQWHGKWSRLRVIGDKKGGGSTDILKNHPESIRRLEALLEIPIKIVHVIRNPFDNIQSIAKHYHRGNISQAIQTYFGRCEVVERERQTISPQSWIDIRHEDLIIDAKKELERLCSFFGINSSSDYLNDCASIVFKNANKRRFEAHWTSDQKLQVRKNCLPYKHLESYQY